MKKIFLIAVFSLLAMSLVIGQAQARGRYGSTRIGGYTSTGKGSHYIGGYVRSCHSWACR